jgi:hypothetical protein
VGTAGDCEAAAAKLAAAVAPSPSGNGTAPAKPCQYATEQQGVYLSGIAPGAPKAGWKTLAEAQAFCCTCNGCGGVTLQDGAYTVGDVFSPKGNHHFLHISPVGSHVRANISSPPLGRWSGRTSATWYAFEGA